MLRIAIWHNLPSGGGKRALYDHVRGLVSRGHHVESWCPSSADASFLPLNDICRETIRPWNPSIKPLRIFSSIRREGAELHSRMQAMEIHCREVAREIDAKGFDILFVNSCQFFRTPPIGKYTNTPSVLYLQEPYRWLYEALPMPPFIGPVRAGRSRFAPWYLRILLKDHFATMARRHQIRFEYESALHFHKILVNSMYSRESVLRAYGLNSTVCYLGIDTSRFRYRDADVPKNQILGIGAFVREKNIEFVLQALSLLPQPQPKLTWIGNYATPKYIQELQSLANSLAVEFQPLLNIPDTQMLSVMQDSLLLAYAPRLEPFGYAPLEANACGLPVIAVAEGGVRETIIHNVNGLLVEASPAAMASAIQELRSNPTKLQRLGRTAHELVNTNWSIEAAIDRLEKQLYSLANHNHERVSHRD